MPPSASSCAMKLRGTIARSPRRARSRSWQLVEVFERAAVDVLQRLDVRDAHVLVDLVDGVVDGPELDNLRADARDEAAVAGATGGRELRLHAVFIANGL